MMENKVDQKYETIRSGGTGAYEEKRGLIAVWGKEAVQFLDGLISNDMKTLEDGDQMLAAFPNAQGRLLAVVRVRRMGDRFLFDTEEATREKVLQNLFRFTFAGDFFVGDTSDIFRYFEVFGPHTKFAIPEGFVFQGASSTGYFVPMGLADDFENDLVKMNAVDIDDELYEILRIESGIPKYGIDMDETTIVPELGLDGLISYNKGCYIGQEIIARIHFRGHVAKRLTGLTVSVPPAVAGGLTTMSGYELTTPDGKNAGRVTSVTFSPNRDRTITLAFVRYDYLAAGTELMAGGTKLLVEGLPFIN
jgi:folate-binding protein YgfZ